MTVAELEKIFKETESNISGVQDNAYDGLTILRKYKGYVIEGADHDVIYGPDIDTILETGLTEEDAKMLAVFNWMLDENGYFTCYV